MNELQIFNNEEFGEVRTVTIENEPWFVGKDVAAALGYKDTADAIKVHVDEEDKKHVKVGEIPTLKTSNYGAILVNESGVYSLVFGSKLESAKRFKHWVTKEVLPTIRKTGSYSQKIMTVPEQIHAMAQGFVEMAEKLNVVNDDLQSFKTDVQDFKDDMPLLAVECEKITNAVRKKGVSVLGGKESNAYNDRSLRNKLYSDLHREIQRQYGVTTYKALKRNQCDEVIDLIKKYQPPIVLAEAIKDCNLQEKLAV